MRAQQAGFVDLACISGAQIDPYGNLNSTCIGDYCHPQVRLAGSGGANDLASSANKSSYLKKCGAKLMDKKLEKDVIF